MYQVRYVKKFKLLTGSALWAVPMESTQNTTTQNANETVQNKIFNFVNEAEQSSQSSKTQFPELIKQQDFMDSTIRVFGTPEEPLFLARDVAEWIDYSKRSDGSYKLDRILDPLDNDEKIKFTTPAHSKGGVLQANTEYWLLTESGLYEVLMLSRKPNAKKFKSKVKEILKTIRKTGGYVANDEAFINTYLPFADESMKILFKTTLRTIQEQNTLIRTQQDTITRQKVRKKDRSFLTSALTCYFLCALILNTFIQINYEFFHCRFPVTKYLIQIFHHIRICHSNHFIHFSF